MELLHMSKVPLPMMLPLLPGSGGGAGGSGGKPAALKAGSLSRLGELQQYLRQCDDQHYLKNYVKVLGSLPRDLLEDLTRTLKARSSWLSCEEQREYKRAKLLNIITGPADGSPPGGHRLGGSGSGGSPGGGMLGGGGVLAGLCSPRRADADAFCRQVLLGGCEAPACGGGGGQGASAGLFEFAAGSEAQLAGLEMRSEGEGEEGQHCMQGATTPFTPFDAPRTKMRLLPPQQQGQGQGLQPAAGAACSSAAEARLAVAAAAAAEPSSTGGKSGTPQDISPLLAVLAAAGVTAHQINRISPDGSGEQAATLAPAAQQQQASGRGSGGGGGRVRQTMLLPDKHSQ